MLMISGGHRKEVLNCDKTETKILADGCIKKGGLFRGRLLCLALDIRLPKRIGCVTPLLNICYPVVKLYLSLGLNNLPSPKEDGHTHAKKTLRSNRSTGIDDRDTCHD